MQSVCWVMLVGPLLEIKPTATSVTATNATFINFFIIISPKLIFADLLLDKFITRNE